MKLKLNQDLRTPQGKKLKGSIVTLECDSNSIPLDFFWRSRLKDSKIDNCLEIINQTKTKK
jgi:hypothetical protein